MRRPGEDCQNIAIVMAATLIGLVGFTGGVRFGKFELKIGKCIVNGGLLETTLETLNKTMKSGLYKHAQIHFKIKSSIRLLGGLSS